MRPNENPNPNLAKQFQIFSQNLAIWQQNIPFLVLFLAFWQISAQKKPLLSIHIMQLCQLSYELN
jgi:hypothetical protein